MRSPGHRSVRRSGEEGSVIMLFSFSMAIVVGMVLAAMVVGRESVARRDMQSAADAAALACAYSIQQHGLVGGKPPFPAYYAAYVPKNTWMPKPVVTCQNFAWNNLHPTRKQNRHVAVVRLSSRLDTEQSWYPGKYIDITVGSAASINEMVFGDVWPYIVFLLDGSLSMDNPILGAAGTSRWNVLSDVITEYVSNTLPARNGLIVYNNTVVKSVNPPSAKQHNFFPIKQALSSTTLVNGTNIAAAFDRARSMFSGITYKGKNVILISDGAPTAAPGCALMDQVCAFPRTRQASDQLRNNARSAIFSVEIRGKNYDPADTQNLVRYSGQPGTSGSNSNMVFPVQTKLMVQAFMNSLTASICAFGPLSPGPNAPPDTYRPRRGHPNPQNLARPRIYAFLRNEVTRQETPIPLVPNRDNVPFSRGFEFSMQAGQAYAVLTLKSCNDLGSNPDHRIVVRWDDAQLVEDPTGP